MSGILAALAGIKTAIATAVDEYFNRTTLLLNTSSTNGAQNNTFLDSSTNNFTITRNGNTTQGTFTPFSQTGWSNYFNGSSTFSFGSNSALNILAYDTFECWVNMSVLGTSDLIAGRDAAYWMGYNHTSIGGTANKFVFAIYNGSSWQAVSSNTTPVVGTWYHILGVKDNTTMRFYVNGVQENTATFSGSPATGSTFYVASNNNAENFEGYVSNLRLVTGASNTVFPYSGLTTGSSFTSPTSALTAVTGTALLTCQSNRFVDNSSNNFSATITSIPSVQAFSPFAPTAAYDAAVVGGSGYFDGSGDYLNFTDSANDLDLGGLVASIEAWVYPTSAAATQHFAYKHGGAASWSASDGIEYAIAFDVNKFYFVYNNGGSPAFITGATTRQPYQWHHVVVATDASNNVALFVNGVREGTATNAITKPTTRTTITVGVNVTGGEPIFGYVSGQRFIKGSGAYDPTQTTITVPTAPPTAVTNTKLLLNYTNAGIYDSTAKSSWETVGNVQVSTAQAKWGTTSIYFPGSSTNQRLLPSQNYPLDVFGTGDFTLECWLYVISQGATAVSGLWDQRPGANGAYINWVVDFGAYGQGSSSNPKLVLYANASVLYASGVLTMGAWNHVALCRASGTTRMFINGTLSGTAVSDTNNYLGGGSAGNYRPSIGSTDGGDSLYGYIDDFRATRYARYTTNFTAPTAAFGTQ